MDRLMDGDADKEKRRRRRSRSEEFTTPATANINSYGTEKMSVGTGPGLSTSRISVGTQRWDNNQQADWGTVLRKVAWGRGGPVSSCRLAVKSGRWPSPSGLCKTAEGSLWENQLLWFGQ